MLPATESLLRAFGPTFCEELPQRRGIAVILHEPGTIVNAIQSASYGPNRTVDAPKANQQSAICNLPSPQPRRRWSLPTVAALKAAKVEWGYARGMKKWLAWLIVGGPVVVYAIGKFLSH